MIYPILTRIASTSKTTEKTTILKENSNNKTLRRVFEFAYNKQINFGFSKAPDFVTNDSKSKPIEYALDFLFDELSTRKITGNTATYALIGVLADMDPGEAKVIDWILQGDLHCGVGNATVNEVWAGLAPVQPQMLCEPQDDVLLEAILNSPSGAVAELKADGARGFSDLRLDQDGVVLSMKTRGGNDYQNLKKIRRAMLSTTFGNWVIDGEFIYCPKPKVGLDALLGDGDDDIPIETLVESRQNSNGIMNKSIAGTISDEEANCVIYQVWDIVPRDVYYGERPCPAELTFKERRKYLESFVQQVKDAGFSCIQIMQQHPVKTKEDVDQWYAYYQGELGLEGIIVKSLDNIWRDTRVSDMIKYKAKIRFDARIIGVYPHKKDPNKLGGIVIQSACKRIECDCGSGFTDTTTKKVKTGKGKTAKTTVVPIPLSERDPLDRELLWSVRNKITDQIVELECNGVISRKKVKTGEAPYKLYLPIMKLFRPDKVEANTMLSVFKK
jgi:hypothetical protein